VALIARAAGTTSDAIVGYAHRHGWPPHPRQPVGAEWRAQRKAAQAAQQALGPVPRRKPVAKPAPAVAAPVAAPVAARGPRREACRPEPLAVPTVAFRTCQWPIGEPRSPGFRFCEALIVGRVKPYCQMHSLLACGHRPQALEEVAA
jgi:GcrA cell cycle regulator